MANRYRGKRNGRKIIFLAGAVLLIVALGVVLSIFVLPEFLVYSDDGSVKLDMPFFTKLLAPPAQTTSPAPDTSMNVIVVTPTPEGISTPEPSPSPVDAPVTKALWVPQNLLGNASKLAQLKDICESGVANTLVLDVKNDDGIMPEPEALAAVVAALKSDNITVVGRLSCFMDNTITRKSAVYGVKHSSGVNWVDTNRMRWLNPYKDEALQFVTECIQKAQDAGFDALLLDNINFPYEGKLTVLDYGADGRTSHNVAINAFIDSLDSFTVPLYAVVLPQTLREGMQAEAGQELSHFSECFDKLFVRVTPDSTQDLAAVSYDKSKLVLITAVQETADGSNPEGYGYLVVDDKGEYPAGVLG